MWDSKALPNPENHTQIHTHTQYQPVNLTNSARTKLSDQLSDTPGKLGHIWENG